MGAPERKKRERGIREEDIIDAAERVFFAHGIDGATMDDVAAEADFSKRTLYKYFSCKEQLALAIAHRGFCLLNNTLRNTASANADKPAFELLQALGRAFLEFHDSHPGHFWTMMMYETREADFGRDDPIAARCYTEGEKTVGLLLNTLRDGVADGSLRRDINPEEAAVVLWAQILGMTIVLSRKSAYLREYRRVTPREMMDALFRYVRRSIENPKGEEK
jgi:AcrR family transcriptional regulator